jgi:hypothetical protein
MKKPFHSLLTFFLIPLLTLSGFQRKDNTPPVTADVVVYGGTSAGITAAIQAARLGKSVVLIEPTNRLGGLTTGGLGQTDIGNKQVIGGISREFYQNIKSHYANPVNWTWQQRSEYKDGGQTKTAKGEDAMWTFEPSVALKVYHDMLKKTSVQVVYNQLLNRESGVKKTGNAITSITMESGEEYIGEVFIDATYEGDLMAAAGVSYAVGRESNAQYGESLNGVQANYVSDKLLDGLSRNAMNHNFVLGVSAYVKAGDPSSGLLPGVNEKVKEDGTGDNKIQAYCFRMCLTDHPENRIAFEKPANYNEKDYELLFRNYEAGFKYVPWIHSMMPNRKSDSNNRTGFSTDFIGQNYNYPEATYAEREKIVERHRTYQQGLMWSLANHPRVPAEIRAEVIKWGTCKDEFNRADGWQEQLYIREARRMVSDYVMTQKHCEGIETVTDAVGMAAYGMDSHHTQRFVNSHGNVSNEGNVEAHVNAPYPISYQSIVPKKSECTNLIVPVCLSATHIAFGSIRMEPVFMVLGESAGTIASLAINEKKSVQNLDYAQIRKALIEQKQVLK